MRSVDMEEVKRRHLDSDAWREVLKRFAAAGESVNAFCGHEGLCANSFRRWRARLAGPTTVQEKPSGQAVEPKPDFVDLGSRSFCVRQNTPLNWMLTS